MYKGYSPLIILPVILGDLLFQQCRSVGNAIIASGRESKRNLAGRLGPAKGHIIPATAKTVVTDHPRAITGTIADTGAGGIMNRGWM